MAALKRKAETQPQPANPKRQRRPSQDLTSHPLLNLAYPTVIALRSFLQSRTKALRRAGWNDKLASLEGGKAENKELRELLDGVLVCLDNPLEGLKVSEQVTQCTQKGGAIRASLVGTGEEGNLMFEVSLRVPTLFSGKVPRGSQRYSQNGSLCDFPFHKDDGHAFLQQHPLIKVYFVVANSFLGNCRDRCLPAAVLLAFMLATRLKLPSLIILDFFPNPDRTTS